GAAARALRERRDLRPAAAADLGAPSRPAARRARAAAPAPLPAARVDAARDGADREPVARRPRDLAGRRRTRDRARRRLPAMKVAHVVIGGDLAGGQLVALELIRALRRRGDDGIVVSPTRGRFT